MIADGAYDSKENFRYLFDNDIEAAIKVRRKNSSADKITDSHPRKIVVQQQLKNFEKWKDSVSYGYRWIAERQYSLPLKGCLENMYRLESIQTWLRK